MGSFSGTGTPTKEEAAAWRLWMREVFIPLNLQMEAVVVQKADLLDDLKMPQSLLLLCVHVAAYKTVLKKWDTNHYSEHASVVNFPAEVLHSYVSQKFTQLKREQQDLLGAIGPVRPPSGT